MSAAGFVQFLQRQRRDGQRSGQFAVGIVAVRGFAEFDRAFINLVVGHQFFGKLGAAAEDDDEQAGGVRIERAAMADFLDAETGGGWRPRRRAKSGRRVYRSGSRRPRIKFEHRKFLRVEERTGYFARVQRLFDGGDHLALHGERFAGNARARGGAMAAAAKLRGDFVHVHLVAFGAQADARQVRFHFLEHAGDDDRLDGADVVNQTLRVVGFRAGAGEVRFLQPEIGDLVVVRQAEMVVNVLAAAARARADRIDKPRRKFSRGSRRA